MLYSLLALYMYIYPYEIEFDAFSVVYNLTRCQSGTYTGVLKVAAFKLVSRHLPLLSIIATVLSRYILATPRCLISYLQ